MSESVSGTVFCSRVCLMRSDLHNEIQAGVACTKGLGRVDPYALSVVSGGDRNKDMGGLLQEDNRDFLFFETARDDHSAALRCNIALQKPLQVTRHVHGRNAKQYVYCGLYEVLEWWPALESDEKKRRLRRSLLSAPDLLADPSFVVADSVERTYFKLLRLPGQPSLPPLQMAFKSERHGSERVFNAHHRMPVPERCFKSTSNYYGTFRPAGSTGPMERFSHNKPCGRNDGIFEADFCSRCGIDGNGLDCMHYCWSCWERGTEVVSHLSCIDRNELLWLLGNEDERHWRCKECRQKGLRPQSGQVYEDAATDLTAQTVAAAATASACAVAPSIAASGLSQAPAAASSGRPKRRRRQTQFFDNSHAAKPDAESSDSNDNSSNDRNYSATHSRCKQHCTSRQARGSRKHGQRITQELWPICKDECTQRCGVHTGDSQWASASGQPTSATQQVAGGQAVQDWLDDASSDDEPKHAVHMPSAVIGRVNAEQVVHKSDEDGDEEGEAAAPGGSLSTAYDTDADFDDDDDDAPAPAAPLRVMSGPTPTALNQHQSVASQGISLQLSSQACSKRAEPAALPPSVEAAAAVAPMPPVMVPRAVKSAESPGNAESPGDAEPSSMIKTAGQPSCGLLSSSTQDMPSASAPQPTTVAELVAAVNAAMPNSEDAIKLKQMEVFSRLKDLVKLEDDQTHHAVDDLQDLAELTHYQALKIRQHYLRLKPPYK